MLKWITSRLSFRSFRGLFRRYSSKSRVRDSIENGQFWSMPLEEFLQMLKEEFEKELKQLRHATALRPDDEMSKTPSPSYILYQKQYQEINRTLVAIMALRWIWNNDYEAFTGGQDPKMKLSRKSFEWLHQLFKYEYSLSTDDIYALVVSVLINDFGKVPSLAKSLKRKAVAHDMILYHAVERRLIPVLHRLSESHREDIMAGIKFASILNIAQLVQAENVPASLVPLNKWGPDSRVFQLRFLEIILDVCGATGDSDWTCAKQMTESVCIGYQSVLDAAHAISKGASLDDGYNVVLNGRLKFLMKNPHNYNRRLDVKKPEERALLRLYLLGRVDSYEKANRMERAFTQLSADIQNDLVRGLNEPGQKGHPAIQISYLPATMNKAVLPPKNAGGKVDEVEAMAGVLKFMVKCFVITNDEWIMGSRAMVIERELKPTIVSFVETDEFKRNPHSLDNQKIPEAHIAVIEDWDNAGKL